MTGARPARPRPAARGGRGPTEADWAARRRGGRASLPADARVLLVCHVNPDGDALGSMLGFGLGLRRLGVRRLQATFPGPPEVPEPFQAMPGLDLLVPADEADPDPDLVDLLRRGERVPARRAGRPAGAARRRAWCSTTTPRTPGSAGSTWSTRRPRPPRWWRSELLDRLGVPLDAAIAECLYVALITDTGSFRFDMTTPAVHEMAARLLATGIRPGEISRRVFDTRPFGAVRLFGDVLGAGRAGTGRGRWPGPGLDVRHAGRPGPARTSGRTCWRR